MNSLWGVDLLQAFRHPPLLLQLQLPCRSLLQQLRRRPSRRALLLCIAQERKMGSRGMLSWKSDYQRKKRSR